VPAGPPTRLPGNGGVAGRRGLFDRGDPREGLAHRARYGRGLVTALGPWQLVGKDHRLVWFADEGLATVTRHDGRRRLVYRGGGSIPLSVHCGRTWVHIGDPDSRDGVIVDCYQGKPGTTAKMYRAEGVDRSRRDYVHPLAAGEQMNNSFVAISLDGQWMVSGEWDKIQRFLVFPTPMLNPAASSTALGLAATLELDRPVRNVQGGVFVDPVTLLCSTDDPDTALWPVARQLLQVDLERPLDGKQANGRVSCLGALPLESRCSGTFEVEGIDYDSASGDLRVVVIPPRPCKWVSVTVYRYRRQG
jgi:hypothetical protein